jgi:hypothetical protein
MSKKKKKSWAPVVYTLILATLPIGRLRSGGGSSFQDSPRKIVWKNSISMGAGEARRLEAGCGSKLKIGRLRSRPTLAKKKKKKKKKQSKTLSPK